MGHSTRKVDALIGDLAARQHGVVTRRQLLSAGLTPWTVASRVSSRRLHPVHRGVYRVGPLTPPRAKEMAAVLICGPNAVVSHTSAAALRGWLPSPDRSDPVHVTVAGRDRGRRKGIRAHRVAALDPEDVTELDGIPVTGPARTLLDIAGVLRGRELERVLARAERRDPTILAELRSLVDRRPKRRGVGPIRRLLRARTGPALTRSEAEERFLATIRKARLPVPETNVTVGPYELDFLWRRQRLAVEVDGYAFHSSKESFESDRRRDADLAARGVQVIRVTWAQIAREPEAMLVRLAQALAAR